MADNCFFDCDDVVVDEPTTFDDPFAPAEVEEVEEVEEEVEDMDEEMDMEMAMEDMDEEDMEEMDPELKNELRMANLAFLAMAGMSTTWAAIDLFFWKWKVVYQGTTSDGTTTETGQVHHYATEYAMISSQTSTTVTRGYWRLGALIGDYATLVIMGVATITQLLSMFGIAASINMMVWMYGVMLGGGVVSMVVGAMWMWAYRLAMKDLTADSDTNGPTGGIQTNGTNASDYASAIEMDMIKAMAHEASATLTAWEYMESWMKAQYHALTPEQQAEWDMKHMDDKEHSDMEKHHDGEWDEDYEKEMSGDDEMSMESEEESEEVEEISEEDAALADFGVFGL